LTILTEGELEVGASDLEEGMLYVVGAAGTIGPIDELATGDWVSFVGIATATNKLQVKPLVGDVQHTLSP
jgi:hypothetical protein